jgi:hypothetical protein
MEDPQRLRQLARWYREFAERTGNPTIWDWRLRTASVRRRQQFDKMLDSPFAIPLMLRGKKRFHITNHRHPHPARKSPEVKSPPSPVREFFSEDVAQDAAVPEVVEFVRRIDAAHETNLIDRTGQPMDPDGDAASRC